MFSKFFSRVALASVCFTFSLFYLFGCGSGSSSGGTVSNGLEVVTFNESVTGMDTFVMQIRIRGVETSLNVAAEFDCENASTKATSKITWTKLKTLSDGIALAANTQDYLAVTTFKQMTFSAAIPRGTIIEIFNKDTNSVVKTAIAD